MKYGLTGSEIQKAKSMGIRFYQSSEENEMAYLKEALKRTDEERFAFLLNLMEMQRIMKEVKFVDEKG